MCYSSVTFPAVLRRDLLAGIFAWHPSANLGSAMGGSRDRSRSRPSRRRRRHKASGSHPSRSSSRAHRVATPEVAHERAGVEKDAVVPVEAAMQTATNSKACQPQKQDSFIPSLQCVAIWGEKGSPTSPVSPADGDDEAGTVEPSEGPWR